MNKKVLVISAVVAIALPIAIIGCKGKTEKAAEAPKVEVTEAMPVTTEESAIGTQLQSPITEPAQTVATEPIPPTAVAPQLEEKLAPVTQEKQNRSKDIQKALKAAGFYSGAIDGKIGPKTKKAIEDFQKSKGLQADGKVGPRTWAELEKYLIQQ